MKTIYSKNRRKSLGSKYRTLWVFILTIIMTLPVGVIYSKPVSSMTDAQQEYYIVKTFDDCMIYDLHNSALDITEDYGYFTLSKLTERQAEMLVGAGYEVEMVDTNVLFPTISFNTKNGEPALSEKLTATSDYYIVQFIGPIIQEWKAQLEDLGAINTDHYWSNHAYIIKMDETTKNNVGDLPFINWVGQYQPAYKFAHDLSEFEAVDTVNVDVFKNEDFYNVIAQIKSLGAILEHLNPKIEYDSQARILIDTSLLPELASIEEVSVVAKYVQPHVMCDQAATEYCTAANLAWYKETSGIDVPTNTWGGLTGYGQVVGITDTGFDTGSASSGHFDLFNGPLGDRFVGIHRSGGCSANLHDRLHAHGTHMVGIIAGNGYCAETHYGMDTTDHVYGGDHVFAGMAPEALISFNAAGDNVQNGGMCPVTPACWQTESADGARIHSNSWGGGSGYAQTAVDADQFMWSNRDNLVFCAAGPAGPSSNTIGPPASAKNDMTVGASGNYRPAYKFLSDPTLVTERSSRGPFPAAPPNRYEPDIVAPGEIVVSLTATAYQYNPGGPDPYNHPNLPEDIYQPGIYMDASKLVNHDYVPDMTWTSVSCACAAGICALIRQYYTDMEGITPSGILMKASLIHGGVDMGYGYPSNDQGWGRVNVKESLFPDAPATVQYYDHRTGISAGNTWDAVSDGFLNTNIQSNRVPLKVTLVTLDTAGNNGRLSNDLDLIVTSPNATVYNGNNFLPLSQWSLPGFTDDDDMLVERVLIEEPEAGLWTIEVNGENTPNGNTPFAIIISGDFGPERDYKVEMTPEFNTTFTCVSGGSTTFRYNILNFGNQNDTIALTDSNLPAGFTVIYIPTNLIDLESNEDADVTVLIELDITVTPKAYRFDFLAISQNDPATPPAQDKIEITCDVQEFAVPKKIRCTDSISVECSPTIATHNDGIDDYLFISYLKYDANGPHVYLRFSTDYGYTWTERQASTQHDAPQDPKILVYPHNSTNYPDRVLIIWHGSDPFAGGYPSYVYCAYADPPYNTWTEQQVVATNAGPDPNNSHRRIAAAIYMGGTGSEELIVTVECIGSSNVIDIYDVYSTTGGASWVGWGATKPAATSNPDFFQEMTTDQNGDVFMVNYRSEGGAVRRQIYLTNYNGGGSWDAQQAISQLNTNWNDVFPAIWSSDEGTSNNRLYVAKLYTTQDPPDPPFTLYEAHSDNTGSTWSGSTGPFGTSASQNGYATGRPLIMGAYIPSDGSNWLTREEEPTGGAGENPNPVPNIHSQYTVNGFASDGLFKVTADSLGKEHPTFAALGDSIYHVFAAQYEPRNKDIWMAVYNIDDCQRQIDPNSVADIEGPEVYNIGITPDPVYTPSPAQLTATIDDTYTGFHDIQAAEYSFDPPSWPGIPMIPSDGLFNSQIESVAATIDTSGLTLYTWYTIWVRGQDSEGNWGQAKNLTFYVDYTPLMPWVEVITPNGGEIWMGGGSEDISWEMGDFGYSLDELVVDIYYSTTGSGGPWNTIVTGSSGYVSNPCFYNWNPLPLVDSDNCYIRINVTNPSALTYFDLCNSSFSIDSTLPKPATNPHAELTGANDVTIYWNLSADDGGGLNDVDHYEIWYRTSGWDPAGDTLYSWLDSAIIPTNTTNYTHLNRGANNSGSYCYQIRTYDVAGHETRTLIQAAKFSRTMAFAANPSHWWLVGSALVQSSTSIDHVVQGLGLPGFCVMAWDAVNQKWLSNRTGRPDSLNDLTDITNEMGFWLEIDTSTRLCTAGYVANMSIDCYAGWNLVTYPYAERNKNTDDIELDLIANCPNYVPGSLTKFDYNEPYGIRLPASDIISNNEEGFWIQVTADTVWTVINY